LSKGFSGAEIEAAVVAALYRAFGRDQDLATRDVAAAMQATVPLSVARAEEISALRRWASERTVSA
jgi:SpoVK/Ycf46/Vps4 family AAA+-type ATPase